MDGRGSRGPVLRYFDSSALAARYLATSERDLIELLLDPSAGLVTSELTRIELARVLRQTRSAVERATARSLIDRDLSLFAVIDIDAGVTDTARHLVADHPIRSLDAIHVATALAVGADEIVTFDRRQAAVGRELGLSVPGECGV